MNKKLTILLLILLFSTPIFAASDSLKENVIKNGIGFGTALAIVISYTHNKSILWAIIQGFFGWLYVIYFFFTRKKEPF